jgi:hypothetical protein
MRNHAAFILESCAMMHSKGFYVSHFLVLLSPESDTRSIQIWHLLSFEQSNAKLIHQRCNSRSQERVWTVNLNWQCSHCLHVVHVLQNFQGPYSTPSEDWTQNWWPSTMFLTRSHCMRHSWGSFWSKLKFLIFIMQIYLIKKNIFFPELTHTTVSISDSTVTMEYSNPKGIITRQMHVSSSWKMLHPFHPVSASRQLFQAPEEDSSDLAREWTDNKSANWSFWH